MKVLTDASKMPKKFENWVIRILAIVDSIFRMLVLPSQKRKREAMFSIVTTKAEKNKSKVPESFQIGYRH